MRLEQTIVGDSYLHQHSHAIRNVIVILDVGVVVHSRPAEDIRVPSASSQTHLCTLDARHRVTASMKDYTADIILVKLG